MENLMTSPRGKGESFFFPTSTTQPAIPGGDPNDWDSGASLPTSASAPTSPHLWRGNPSGNGMAAMWQTPSYNRQLPVITRSLESDREKITSFVNGIFTRTLVPDFDNCIDSIKALVSMAGLPQETLQYLALNNIPCYEVIDPLQKTVCRIMTIYHNLLHAAGYRIPFHLSSETLLDMVNYIDCLPKALGYSYTTRLRQECETLVPQPITDSSPLEDLAQPFQIFRASPAYFQCRFLDMALTLCAMLRFVRLNHYFAFVDWTQFIVTVQIAPVERMPMEMARAIQLMLGALQAQGYTPEELASVLNTNLRKAC